MRRLHTSDPPEVAGYRLTGVLGDGGQGTVYLGIGADGERVAVKVLHARLLDDRRAVRRFLAEAATAEQVAGFCTARVIESGLAQDRPYLVSEYVEGPSLQELIAQDGPLTGGALERLAVGTITAMAAIHGAGIVHRDFKPSNVLIAQDGPRVIDFGIARTADAATTATSSIIGTPGYMAPEQIAGERASAASDLFSWAATIGYAAAGEPLFGGASIPAVMHRILTADPDLSGVAEPLRSQLAACLAKDPGRRPTAQEVLDALVRRTGDVRVARRRRRRRAVTGVGGLVVAGGLVLGLLWSGSAPNVTQPSPQVQQQPRTFVERLGTPFGPANAQVSALALGEVRSKPVVAVADQARGVIEVWDPRYDSDRLWSFPVGSTQKVLSIAVTEVGGHPTVVWTDTGGTLRTWDLEAGRKGRFFSCGGEGARMVVAGKVAFLGCSNGLVHSIDLATVRAQRKEMQLDGAVTALAWDGQQVIAGSSSGQVIGGESTAFLEGPIRALAASGEGRIAVTAGGRTRVYDPGLTRVVADLESGQPALDLIGRNGTVLIAAGGQGLAVWEPDGTKLQLLSVQHQVTAVATGEIGGGKAVVAGIDDGRLQAWSLLAVGGSRTKE